MVAKLDCDVDVEGAADMMDGGEGGDSRRWCHSLMVDDGKETLISSH
jgi:hypothetical protein